ncbi:putative bifunctional diguanylate cyclase/phosphodiesterase [Oryzibacter oryziterrae]|uniref:putative bifunctional diguanylate cyclase/phosphodiesterase n=1 Tax=Oryzibacter oryziterrae TaxID=2766474 RepID=UPI001F2AABFD|nr:EAL domain-containing protein [Oryzibacter oryziterrae]
MSFQAAKSVRRRILLEAVIIFTACLLAFVVASNLGLHERLHEWASGHPGEMASRESLAPVHAPGEAPTIEQNIVGLALLAWPSFGADEIITFGLFLSLALAIFTSLQLLRMRRTLNERILAEATALQLALHDALTGLPNRRQFEDWLGRYCVARPAGIRALLFLDLDGFKPVNDVYGHAAGDTVLVDVASRLKAIGGIEICARFGGDEFAILSEPLASRDQALAIAQTVLAAFAEPFAFCQGRAFVGTSIGVSLVEGGSETVEEKLRQADVALYKSKCAGRSRISFFDVELDEAVRARNSLEMRLRQAIEDDLVVPYFQPLVDIQSGEVVGFEALARWTDPEAGVVPPDRFIPLAEEAGLIDEIGRVILVKAVRQAVTWPEHMTLSVNLSPVQLKDPALGLKILNILTKEGFSPRRLEVEITENALVADIEMARVTFEQFRTAGIKIILDDFGTGHSSLNHLRVCKFDMLKIDRSFVMSLGEDSEAAKIVDAIMGLSRSFGIPVIAEGIETEMQLETMRERGCGKGQGYLFSRPLEDVSSLLNASTPKGRSAVGSV